jgi:predicted 2-oxoglutarate/Fe(II)-dependent dioxygenase YbiX
MGLSVGELAPRTKFATAANPTFQSSALAGRWVIFAAAADADGEAGLLGKLRALGPRLDGWDTIAFVIRRNPDALLASEMEAPGLRFVLDPEHETARAFDLTGGGWLLLDPMLRVHATSGLADTEAFLRQVVALPGSARHAGCDLVAPILLAPRVFEPEICRRLIALYEADGGAPSGVMREIDGRTVPVLDDFKRRRDAFVTEEPFQNQLRVRIARRLVPEIERALQFTVTRIERYIVACYDADSGGYFRPHRDDTTKGTAHRKFAVSINLNDDFEGGDLRFPEFGPQTYRPPAGGAVVFSCSLLHEATPVTRGRRYAFLPFLFDEEGARIRRENLQYLDPPSQAEASA